MNGLAALSLTLLLGGQGAPRPQTPQSRPGAPAQAASQPSTSSDTAKLQRAVSDLVREVRLLREDLALRQIADEFTIGQLRLMLLDERIARLDREQSDLQARLSAAIATERDLQRRLDNIDTELILYGGLNREDSRRAITTSLTEQLNRAREEEQRLRVRAVAIGRELTAANQEAETLRAKLVALARQLGRGPDGSATTTTDDSARPRRPYVPGEEQRRPESGEADDEPPSPNR